MPALKTYDLFISHAWTHHAEYDRLVKRLRATPNFKPRDYSVPKQNPLDANNDAKLTAALKRQIRPVNCVLILAGMYVNHRKWIKKGDSDSPRPQQANRRNQAVGTATYSCRSARRCRCHGWLEYRFHRQGYS